MRISHLVAVVLDVLLHLAAVLPPLDCDVRHEGWDQLDTGHHSVSTLSIQSWLYIFLSSLFPVERGGRGGDIWGKMRTLGVISLLRGFRENFLWKIILILSIDPCLAWLGLPPSPCPSGRSRCC